MYNIYVYTWYKINNYRCIYIYDIIYNIYKWIYDILYLYENINIHIYIYISMLNMQIYIYMCMFLSLHTPKQPQEEVGSDMKVLNLISGTMDMYAQPSKFTLAFTHASVFCPHIFLPFLTSDFQHVAWTSQTQSQARGLPVNLSYFILARRQMMH